jgi:hypothetical protein
METTLNWDEVATAFEGLVPEWLKQRFSTTNNAMVNNFNDEFWKTHFVSKPEIQDVAIEYSYGTFLVGFDKEFKRIETIAFKLCPDLISDKALEYIVAATNQLWACPRHTLAFVQQDPWFRSFLFADYFKGNLWAIENSLNAIYSDISCLVENDIDGWICLSTKLEAPKPAEKKNRNNNQRSTRRSKHHRGRTTYYY